ncbi:DegV family protein [Mycoplasmoides pneumoniae]|uniref:DegV domain-containing protein MG326 homolog n=4 Tax=Mycoplasmoides pneumoniae TaxID=2104 RepID=Y472_MYCPN|nr:DegV family protein [Mycoplasmoides pneumoniae]P75312.1 RecName: Full=DegV domain-containing protein MG326 homolog [Mycoplasmoides pneumoniae M129]AAB96017.1 conserved hypothetical protein [Mycoplasmoides pneumoniae M129]ADK86693.1 EDD domain protein, DegV family [Mycoplasmoides pneumoniae FH]AGC04365.1 DegV domain-containing protein MG326 [Mycoplasmoides pneumoniae M129-B7]ALA30345.1 DegV domain-containing protein MG326 [Mycoplasmoides pneumoniae PI 1428]ALA30633.1 DegV domain-containing 
MKTAIITDSTASIKEGEIQDVYVLPLQVIINGQDTYRDGKDIDYDRVYQLLKEHPQGLNISTSLPRQADLIELIEAIKDKYDRFVFLPLSKGLSGTYDMIVQAVKPLSTPKKEFVVLETSDIAISLKWLVQEVKALTDTNCPTKAIAEVVDQHKQSIFTAVTVKNLVQLRKGGRISGLKKIIATLLRVKPIIFFDKGVNTLSGKAFTFVQALEKIFTFVKSKFGDNFKIKRIGFCNAFTPVKAKEVKALILDFLHTNKITLQREIESSFITSAIIAHTGIDAFSISLLLDKNK